jgi:hypothetical protein
MKTKSIEELTKEEFENRFNTSKMAKALRQTTGYSHRAIGGSIRAKYKLDEKSNFYLLDKENKKKIVEISPLQILNGRKNRYENAFYKTNEFEGIVYFLRLLKNFHCQGENEEILNQMEFGILLGDQKPKEIAKGMQKYDGMTRSPFSGSIGFLAHNGNSISLSKTLPERNYLNHIYIEALTNKFHNEVIQDFGGIENAEKKYLPHMTLFKNPSKKPWE